MLLKLYGLLLVPPEFSVVTDACSTSCNKNFVVGVFLLFVMVRYFFCERWFCGVELIKWVVVSLLLMQG
jgi:hypothetical protein